jgi:hypothetical protein
MRVRSINVPSFYDLCVGFWNFSDSVVFFVRHLINKFTE